MKYILLSLFVASLIFTPAAFASSDVSLADALSDILQAQQINQVQEIDCRQVSAEQFVVLGDAVMEQIHPGDQHEVMDAMMGGEGSDSLAAMHLFMGQQYLGCSNSGYGMMGGGMMGPTTMMGIGSFDGPAKSFNQYSSTNFGYSSLSLWWLMPLVTTILIWIVLILGIMALLKFIKSKK